MHSQFSLHRFWLVMKLYVTENGKSYLISLSLIAGTMLLLMLPMLRSQYYNDLLMILHAIALFACVIVGGSLYTSTAFSVYSHSAQGIPALMLPASRLEKFLVVWLFHLLFTILIIVLFWQLHYGLTEAANQSIPDRGRKYIPIPVMLGNVFTYFHFLIQSVIFLGSVYFLKNAYIKTAGSFLLVVVLAFLFNYALVYQFTDHPVNLHAFPFSPWTIFHDKVYRVDFPEPIASMIWLFLIMLVVSLWYVAYVRLKEKEI